MQDEPKMVFDLIFGHLAYEDVLVLRATCKALKEFVDEKTFVKLNLFVRKFPFHHRLFYTGEPIGHPHSYRSEDLAILDSKRFRKQFTSLQQLSILNKRVWNDSKYGEFDLNNLNFFRELIYLEVDEFPRIKGKLNLPKLEIAAFRIQIKVGRKRVDSVFELNCPNLKVLKINFCLPVLTPSTNRLIYLHFGYFEDRSDYLKSIEPNLRQLTTICLESIRLSLEFIADFKTGLLSLPMLNQIRLEKCIKIEQLDNLASSLEDLQRDPRKKHIQFSFVDQPIRFPDELRRVASLIRTLDPALDLRFLKDRPLAFLCINPELHFLLSEARYLDLQESNEWDEKIVKKLQNVEFLKFTARYKPSQSTLELFARTCKMVRLWTLYHQTVTERLLDVMAEHLINLERVQIYGCQYETLCPLAKLRNLERIDLDFEPPRDEVTFIFENSAALESVNTIGKRTVVMMRTTTVPRMNRIIIIKPHQTFFFVSLQEMIEQYYERRLFEKIDNYVASSRLDPPMT